MQLPQWHLDHLNNSILFSERLTHWEHSLVLLFALKCATCSNWTLEAMIFFFFLLHTIFTGTTYNIKNVPLSYTPNIYYPYTAATK